LLLVKPQISRNPSEVFISACNPTTTATPPFTCSLPSAKDTPSYITIEEKTAYKQNVRKYDIVEGEKILVYNRNILNVSQLQISENIRDEQYILIQALVLSWF
jgi:hypothetical protein